MNPGQVQLLDKKIAVLEPKGAREVLGSDPVGVLEDDLERLVGRFADKWELNPLVTAAFYHAVPPAYWTRQRALPRRFTLVYWQFRHI